MIESGSSLATFLTCPRKYKYSYIDRLESPGYSSALGFGTFVHACIEDWKKDLSAPAAVNAYLKEEERARDESKEQIAHDWSLAQAMVEEWAKYWDAFEGHLGNRHLEWSSTEDEWNYQAAPGFTLVGKRDGVAKHKSFNRYYLHEVKTSGDTDRETYQLKLQMDRQISVNVEALKREGIECAGALYDICWKAKLVRGVNRKTKPDETYQEFRDRIIADVRLRPEHYFTRLMVQRSQQDLAQAQQDLVGQFEMVQAGERAGYPRNQSACERFGSLCPFFHGCMDAIAPEEMGMRKRELKFPELSPEFQASLKADPIFKTARPLGRFE